MRIERKNVRLDHVRFGNLAPGSVFENLHGGGFVWMKLSPNYMPGGYVSLGDGSCGTHSDDILVRPLAATLHIDDAWDDE